MFGFISVLQTPYDTDHKIRVALGNGLRKDIWTEFQSRFQIKDVVEFYGATELPVGFINVHNKAGAVGKLNPLVVCNDYQILSPLHVDNFNCFKTQSGTIEQHSCLSRNVT